MATRRNVLRILGGGVIAAAAGGAGAAAFLTTRTPTRALEPWNVTKAQGETPIHQALAHAILAPNPHNRQPWIVELSGDLEAVLYYDTTRDLPETDPFDRQLTIGLGCFLEVCAIAATASGHRADIELFPDGYDHQDLDTRPVARIRLATDPVGRPSDLAAAITERRTYKDPFDVGRPISEDKVAAILKAGEANAVRSWGVLDQPTVESLRDITWQAWVVEAQTPRTYLESVDLMRIGKAEIEASPDGIDLGGPFLETLHLAGLLNRKALADPTSQAYRQGFSLYSEILSSAMGYIAIATPSNTRLDQIEAGRAFVRQQLLATKLGIAVHPLSQALQEYPEMDDTRSLLDSTLGVTGPERLQMLSRIGYVPASERPQPPSPRWPLASRLKDA